MSISSSLSHLAPPTATHPDPAEQIPRGPSILLPPPTPSFTFHLHHHINHISTQPKTIYHSYIQARLTADYCGRQSPFSENKKKCDDHTPADPSMHQSNCVTSHPRANVFVRSRCQLMGKLVRQLRHRIDTASDPITGELFWCLVIVCGWRLIQILVACCYYYYLYREGVGGSRGRLRAISSKSG